MHKSAASLALELLTNQAGVSWLFSCPQFRRVRFTRWDVILAYTWPFAVRLWCSIFKEIKKKLPHMKKGSDFSLIWPFRQNDMLACRWARASILKWARVDWTRGKQLTPSHRSLTKTRSWWRLGERALLGGSCISEDMRGLTFADFSYFNWRTWQPRSHFICICRLCFKKKHLIHYTNRKFGTTRGDILLV